MRNLLSMLLVFSFLFTIGCGDDDATESNPLVGVWNMTSVSFTNDGTTTTIDASNDFSIVFGVFSSMGLSKRSEGSILNVISNQKLALSSFSFLRSPSSRTCP